MLRFFLLLLIPGNFAVAGLEWRSTTLKPAVAVEDESVTVAFEFKNSGATAIAIRALKTSCGCLAAELEKKRYEPGEAGEIRATFKVGDRTGRQREVVRVFTDENRIAPTKLIIEIDLPELVALDRQILEWKIGAKPAGQKVHAKPADGIEITGVSATAEEFAVSISAPDRTPRVITVTPLKTEAPLTALLQVAYAGSRSGAVTIPLIVSRPMPAVEPASTAPADEKKNSHVVAVNQVGYESDRAKRFTAPVSWDGSEFVIKSVKDGSSVFEGKVKGCLGDFTEFVPPDPDSEYFIEVTGGGRDMGKSAPFAVRSDLYREQFWQSAVDFMIDCRSVSGSHPSALGGTPWRDGAYYDSAISSLVMLGLASRETVEAMPHQIDWEAEKKRTLSPDFKFAGGQAEGEKVMATVTKYYTDLAPPKPDAPDVAKLIHWGLGWHLIELESAEPSVGLVPVQSQTVEEFAWVLWAWDHLELDRWFDPAFREKCEAFAFEHWESTGCLGIPIEWDPGSWAEHRAVIRGDPRDPYKGRNAPGHSILPNLFMHEVAKAKGRADAGRYLKAAIDQAQWVLDHIDWKDPRSTKGQRMSEHKLMPGLVYLLQNYPQEAPSGIREKIEEWAEDAVAKSDNMWDFRRYDKDHWTIPGLNEPGNLAGFPASALSACWVISDPEVKERLHTIAVAQFDTLFGRNPQLAAAPYHPEMGFPLVETGWPVGCHENACARMELVRGTLSSSPGSEKYPFNPEGRFRHMEGWVAFNAAWNMGLAYFALDRKQGELKVGMRNRD